MGAYLFYAQHNFPTATFAEKEGWSYVNAALGSSSYMRMNQVMHWFTGNIGYHHIHHLNARIPFYRLPEVYKAIPELQMAKTTSLMPGEMIRCLRLKVWDPVNRPHDRVPGDGAVMERYYRYRESPRRRASGGFSLTGPLRSIQDHIHLPDRRGIHHTQGAGVTEDELDRGSRGPMARLGDHGFSGCDACSSEG